MSLLLHCLGAHLAVSPDHVVVGRHVLSSEPSKSYPGEQVNVQVVVQEVRITTLCAMCWVLKCSTGEFYKVRNRWKIDFTLNSMH